MSDELLRKGTGGDFLFTGLGTKRRVSARNVARQFERVYGKKGSKSLRRARLDYRVDKRENAVVVYEDVPFMACTLTPGVAVLTRMSVPITDINENYGILDIARNARVFQGQSSAEAIAKVDDRERAESEWRVEDIDEAARRQADKWEKGQQHFGSWSHRG